jgi:hypothetical protein
MTSTRVLVADLARLMTLAEQIDAAIDRDGPITKDGKAHPGIAARVALSTRIASIFSRLRALPTGDARELGRAERFESTMRAVTERAAGDDLLA